MSDSVNAGAPGTTPASTFENGHARQPTATHMPPPPLPPLQTGAIPNVTSPLAVGIASPTSAGGTVRRAAPEPNKRALYVGGLDQRVTEDVLRQIFETTGHVQSVKIIPDKNQATTPTGLPQQKGYNYGFVEYDDPGAAERAMATLNGRRVMQQEIKVNWAYQSNASNKEDTTNHYHIFVGDLSNEVNDDVLLEAFSSFGSVSEARVMWDMKTGRSRGYGFVAYREKSDAEKALGKMDQAWLGSRQIRCNWANQKGQPSVSQQQAMIQMGIAPTAGFGHHQYPTNGAQSYDMIVSQTPQWQSTCYVGNLTPYTTQNDLVPLFQNFGYVVETRFQSDRGFAFVKMDTHENAAMAICQLSGYNVNGRPLKCSWGKDRPNSMVAGGSFDGFSPQSAGGNFAQSPAAYFPQYGGQAGPMSPQGSMPSAGFAQSPGGFPQQYNAAGAGGYGQGAAAASPQQYGTPRHYGNYGYQT